MSNVRTHRNHIGQVFVLVPITRTSTLVMAVSGAISIDMPMVDLELCWHKWRVGGMMIQDAFPTLSAEQREFLLSGITPEQWKEMFENGPAL